jgi:rhodanese-related sulfurtransferase
MTVHSISSTEFAQRIGKEQELDLIDVRTPGEFREVHLASARNVPLDALDPAAISKHGAGKPLYIVCRSGARARQACEKLLQAGHDGAINIEGGILACIEAGLPVVRGKKTISLERQVRMATGTLVLSGVALGWFVHPGFFGLSAFVGAGLLFAGITDTCGMGILLSKMPWNR